MICDAHVHVGYWGNGGEMKYYSPSRVVGVLNRCGVDEFIVSSTSPQAGAIGTEDLVREAREVRRLAGTRAHVYCWITWEMYNRDPDLSVLECGIYDGIKLHERETPWNTGRRAEFRRILEIAESRNLNVMLHCGRDGGCTPLALRWVARQFAKVKFNFAHCCPIGEIESVMQECENVYSDVSCLPVADMKQLQLSRIWPRIMFGSDFPAICGGMSLTDFYRKALSNVGSRLEDCFNSAFKMFVSKR